MRAPEVLFNTNSIFGESIMDTPQHHRSYHIDVPYNGSPNRRGFHVSSTLNKTLCSSAAAVFDVNKFSLMFNVGSFVKASCSPLSAP